jgi:hypothetical protein
MGIRKTTVPSLPPAPADDKGGLLASLKQLAEVREGLRGDPLDRFVTVRELEDAGLVVNRIGGIDPGGASARPGGPTNPGPVGGNPPDYGENDFTRPPRASNVAARGVGENSIMVTWDGPRYGNHWYTEVYRIPREYPVAADIPVPTLSNLLVNGFDEALPYNSASNNSIHYVGMATGNNFLDTLPRDGLYDPNSPGTTVTNPSVEDAMNPRKFYYWVRFVSRANVAGPFHVTPAIGNRTINPAEVLDALTTGVRGSLAFRNLRRWIGIMDDPAHEAFATLRARGGVGPLSVDTSRRVDVVERVSDANTQSIAEGTYWQASMLTDLANFADPGQAVPRARITEYRVEGSLGMFRIADIMPEGVGGAFGVSSTNMFVSCRTPALRAFAGKRLSVGRQNDFLTFPLQDWMPQSAVLVGIDPQDKIFDAQAAVRATVTVGREVLSQVSSTGAIGKHVDSVRVQLQNNITAVNTTVNSVRADVNGIANEYSVLLGQDQSDILSMAGFSITLENSLNSTKPARSAMVVAADRFAIVGTGSGASRISGWARGDASAQIAQITLRNAGGIAAVFSRNNATNNRETFVTFAVPDSYRQGVFPDEQQLLSLKEISCRVVSVIGNVVTVDSPMDPLRRNARSLPFISPVINPAETVNSQGQTVTVQRDFWSHANIVLMPEQSMPFIVDTVNNVVGIRGDLVVDGMATAQDVTVRNLLTAKEIWTESIVGIDAKFDTSVGQKIFAGNIPALRGTQWSGQTNYVLRLQNPAIQGRDGKVVRFYRPQWTYQSGIRAEVQTGDDDGADVFWIDGSGNVFIGGNVTIRTNGTYYAGFGIGTPDAQGRKFALWAGPKQFGAINPTKQNAALYVHEDGSAGINGDFMLNGMPLTQPMLATGVTPVRVNPNDATFTYLGNSSGSEKSWNNGLRASTAVTDVFSDGWFDYRFSADGSRPLIMVTASVSIARLVNIGQNNDKRFIMSLLIRHEGGTDVVVHSIEMDDYPPETYTATLMGVCHPPLAGRYKVRVMLLNLRTSGSGATLIGPTGSGFMSILRGWTSYAQYMFGTAPTNESLGSAKLMLAPSQAGANPAPPGWAPPPPPPNGGGGGSVPWDPEHPPFVP